MLYNISSQSNKQAQNLTLKHLHILCKLLLQQHFHYLGCMTGFAMSVYIYISAVVYNSDILNLTYIYNVHDILQKISNVIQKN